jgi:hypothetical protein
VVFARRCDPTRISRLHDDSFDDTWHDARGPPDRDAVVEAAVVDQLASVAGDLSRRRQELGVVTARHQPCRRRADRRGSDALMGRLIKARSSMLVPES